MDKQPTKVLLELYIKGGQVRSRGHALRAGEEQPPPPPRTPTRRAGGATGAP